MNTFFQFKKQRELGDILSDTFAFLRAELKPFFSLIFKIIAPYLIVFIASLGFFLYSISGAFSNMLENQTDFPFDASSGIIMVISIIALVISSIAVYTLSHAATLYYIRSYSNNNGVVNAEEVQKDSKENFWSFFGLGILVGLIVGFGAMCCFIPGIYLYVPMSLTFAIYVYNHKTVSDSISFSFKLVKDEWWITFATLIVLSIVVGVASYVFGLPGIIYSWLKMGIFSDTIDLGDSNTFSLYSDPIYLVLSLISYAAQFFLNFITIIATALIYFNLNEKKHFTGTFERISNIGNNTEA